MSDDDDRWSPAAGVARDVMDLALPSARNEVGTRLAIEMAVKSDFRLGECIEVQYSYVG